MSTNLLTPTDEPQVTERTRFWLYTEFRTTYYDHGPTSADLTITHGETLRIKAEVDEATYRKVYAETTGHASDITLPLDDYWWSDKPIAGDYWKGWILRRTRGGVIDWEPLP